VLRLLWESAKFEGKLEVHTRQRARLRRRKFLGKKLSQMPKKVTPGLVHLASGTGAPTVKTARLPKFVLCELFVFTKHFAEEAGLYRIILVSLASILLCNALQCDFDVIATS